MTRMGTFRTTILIESAERRGVMRLVPAGPVLAGAA